MTTNELPVLVEVRRGGGVEARHHGAIIAVDPDARVVARLGDERLITYTRSAIKPIQAIPLITSGAADHFGITPRELAVACASHDGEPLHTYSVARLLARAGLDERALRCGVHRPYSEETAVKLERDGLPFTQLHNNCSGKHAGMLATAVRLGLATDDYISPDHPVQRAILSTFSRFGGLKDELPVAVDGCSAPTFAVPLNSLAVAFARLVSPWSSHPRVEVDALPALSNEEADAAKRIVAAMTAQPEMVGGTKGRLDTDLMRAVRGKLIGKIGAEAVYSIGVLPCDRFPRGLGIAIKIGDGARRALDPTVLATLIQLGLLGETEQQELSDYHNPMLKNHRGLTVGEVRPVFDLGADSR